MTTLAGQVLKDTVGNNVTDLAPLFRSGEMKFAEQVLAGLDIPQAELRAQPLLFVADPSGDDQVRGGAPKLSTCRCNLCHS